MKMKVGTRVVLTVYLIAVIALCGFMLATIGGFLPGSNLKDFTNTAIGGAIFYKILYAVIAIVMIIISFMLMFFGTGKAAAPKTAKVATFESGSVLITIKAIEELVERHVHENKNVKGLKTCVFSRGESIDISLEICVLPDVDIPAVTKELQTGLNAYIQEHTGILVNESKIMVTGLKENSGKVA
ncbi:MAG: alkaline shock response membrane anchor protein AmaP [Christensenella sp.]